MTIVRGSNAWGGSGRLVRVLLVVALVLGIAAAVSPVGPGIPKAAADTSAAYPGLGVSQILSGLRTPTSARIAADGRIFVANKRGDIWMFDGPGDTSQVVTLDLRLETHSIADRGLLGIELDPQFTTGRPYIYALYTYNRDPFGSTSVPRWGTGEPDSCPSPPGSGQDGCTVTARLVRYTVGPNGVAALGSRVILVDSATAAVGGWCFQYSSHSNGTVAFGPDGALYAGAGDGASWSVVDYGQYGGSLVNTPTPVNPCNDSPGGRGTVPNRATSSGGALRSQAVRAATATGYLSWNGSIIRVNPDTGAAMPDNPLVGNGIAEDDRIIAYGLRNPFRFGFRPGTDELWVGDVGASTYEEVSVVRTGSGQTSVPNLGWPCYEGPARMGAYDSANLGLCESLYAQNSSSLGGVPSPLTFPRYSYTRDAVATPAAGCGATGGGAVTGGQFVTSPGWPVGLRGAYVFADYVRGCIVALPLGADGNPDPARRVALVTGATAVDLQRASNGDLYWVDIATNSVNRLYATTGNQPPVATFTATPQSGPLPLTVQFDASGSYDPDLADTLTFAWDLDGDGACDDGTGVTTQRQYTVAGPVSVKLCATDTAGATSTSVRVVSPGADAPVITSLSSNTNLAGWSVGNKITFAATATTTAGVPLPNSAYAWVFDIRHCESEAESSCHTHPFVEAVGPSVTVTAPDHEYYAYIRATLTVTGGNGLTAVRTIDARPRVSYVTLGTRPAGIGVTNGLTTGMSPVLTEYLTRGKVQLQVPTTAVVAGRLYRFTGWTDGSVAGTFREYPAPSGSTTKVAVYELADGSPVVSSVSVTPVTVQGVPATITFSARATDDVGVSTVRARITDPAGRAYTATLALTSGTVTSGVWSGTVRLPSTAIAGSYVTRVNATDTGGVLRGLNGPTVQVSR